MSFDWREIGRIGWQKEQLASLVLDQLRDLRGLMDSKIIHDYDLPGDQAWGQDLFKSFPRLKPGDSYSGLHKD